ncbi:MAG: hypothetical protein ACKV2V_10495 [Blastocatellia bacterium]
MLRAGGEMAETMIEAVTDDVPPASASRLCSMMHVTGSHAALAPAAEAASWFADAACRQETAGETAGEV